MRYLNRSMAFDWLYDYPGFDAALKDQVAADLVAGAEQMLALPSLEGPGPGLVPQPHRARAGARGLLAGRGRGPPLGGGTRRPAARAGVAGVRQPARADRAREPGRGLPRVDRLHAHHVGAARDDGRGAPHVDGRGPGGALVRLPQHGDDLPLQGAARRQRGPRRRRRVPAPRRARQRRARLRGPPLQGPLRGLAPAAAGVAPRRVGEPGAPVPVERPRGRPPRPRDHDRERAAAPPALPRRRPPRPARRLGEGLHLDPARLRAVLREARPPRRGAPRRLPQGLPGDRRRGRLHRHREPALPQPLPADDRPQHGARLPAGRALLLEREPVAGGERRRPEDGLLALLEQRAQPRGLAPHAGPVGPLHAVARGRRADVPLRARRRDARLPAVEARVASRARSCTCARRTPSSCSTACARPTRPTARPGCSTA